MNRLAFMQAVEELQAGSLPAALTCFACGDKMASLPLSAREWQCPAYGSRHDRDVNAAINLATPP